MPKLTLCLVTKNNENSLRRCFYPIHDFLHEILAIDMGSMDNTQKILQDHKARIIDYKFENDISAVKNKLIAEASGDFILFLNPDEVIFREDMKKLLDYLDKNPKDAMAYMFCIRNYTHNTNARGFRPSRIYGFEGYFTSEQVRLIINNKLINYSFAIDETLMPCLEQLNAIIKHVVDIPIHNYSYQARVELLEEAAKKSSDTRVFYNTAIAHLNTGNVQKAKEYLKKVVEREPSYKKALFNLAALYMAEDKLGLAAKMFSQSLDFDDKNAGAYYNLAIIFQKNKKFEKAELLLKKALAIEPDDFRIYKNLAFLYQEMGRKEEARKAINSAIRCNPYDKGLMEFKNSLG